MTEQTTIEKPAKWYIIHAYSNFEKKVASAIMEQAANKGLEEFIADIKVPTEEVVEVVRGKKRTSERRFFPGYVLIKAHLTDEIYHLVNETGKVTGFLGANGGKKPLPIRQKEVDRILGTGEDMTQEPTRPLINFEVGEQVQVNDGPFQGFEGAVENIDQDGARLKVNILVFGRSTPVDLDFTQVKKI